MCCTCNRLPFPSLWTQFNPRKDTFKFPVYIPTTQVCLSVNPRWPSVTCLHFSIAHFVSLSQTFKQKSRRWCPQEFRFRGRLTPEEWLASKGVCVRKENHCTSRADVTSISMFASAVMNPFISVYSLILRSETLLLWVWVSCFIHIYLPHFIHSFIFFCSMSLLYST